jgi:hypothetical protein
MRAKGNTILVFIVLVATTALVVSRTLPPSPLPATAPDAEFSAERAIRHIHVIAREPHPTGSPANEAVRNYILTELQKLGLETETQRDDDLENVMARLPGTQSADAVLLTAHLDSTLQSPGAMDDGSGVAGLLETARALMTDEPLRNTVMFLFTDHEEGGLYGAKAFIARHPWVEDVQIVIGLDAGGISGPGVLSATSAGNGWLIQQVIRADPYLVGSSAINALAESSTDFGRAFKEAGFSGYAFDLYWDKGDGAQDNIENINPSSIQHQGYHALSLVRHLGDLDQLTDAREPDAVYFNILRLYTVNYSPVWAIPLAVANILLFGAILTYGLRRAILSWGGIGYGIFVLLVSLVIAALPSLFLEFIMGPWLPGVTADYDNRALDQPFQMSMIVLIALALVSLWYSWSQRFRATSVPDLAIGALVPIAAGMAATSLAFPALSYGFTWPFLFSLLACANWFYWRAGQRDSKTVIAGLLFSEAANLVILGPGILLGLFSQLSLTLVFLGALCGFLLPQLHILLGHKL